MRRSRKLPKCYRARCASLILLLLFLITNAGGLVALHLFVSMRLESKVWLHHCLGKQMHTHAATSCATLPFDDETNHPGFSLFPLNHSCQPASIERC
ncbi:hypothetical protein HDV63DRAFT_346015 [Trichoderma sp. SZMC 28014]